MRKDWDDTSAPGRGGVVAALIAAGLMLASVGPAAAAPGGTMELSNDRLEAQFQNGGLVRLTELLPLLAAAVRCCLAVPAKRTSRRINWIFLA